MNLLFQYLNLFFDIILWPFSSFPKYVDIVFISLISAAIFLYIFKKTSNQQKIKYYKERIYGNILQIVIYKDQLRVIFQSILGILKYNIIYIGYMLPPLLFIIIPLWIFTTQINNRFGYAPLEKNQTFILRLNLDRENTSYHDNLLELVQAFASERVALEIDPLRVFSEGSIFWRARLVGDADNHQSVQLRIDHPKEEIIRKIVTLGSKESFSPNKSKWQFYNLLEGNAETFITDGSLFKSVTISYQRRYYRFILWDMDPIIIYFILTLVFGFILKPIFKVNI